MRKTDTLLTRIASLALLAGLMLTACTSNSGDDMTSVSLQFNTLTNSNPKIAAKSSLNNDTLRIEGSNGTLIIDDIRFIVEDFELERSSGECEGLPDEDDCEEFEADPFFVDLPLTADSISLGNSLIEPGLYVELEFETDDLDVSEEEDPVEQQQKQDLINAVRAVYSDWPTSASMVITGSFVSSQGDTTQFKTYAEAEIEIELEFNPPLEITENSVSKLIKLNINPVDWFLRADNTVIDLSQYDYETTQELLEFELEIENSFKSLEVEDDDD